MLCCVVCSGVLTTSFEENPRLKDFFKVLALSLDNKGLPYIALMEAKKVSGTDSQLQDAHWLIHLDCRGGLWVDCLMLG